MSKHLPPEVRRQSLEDSFVPLRLQWAVAEASRCLMCDDPPCQKGCLAGVDIKKFIRAVRSRNLRLATSVIRDANFLVASCGRICPQAQLCEGRCSATGLKKPIAIGELQRFVGETAIKDKIPTSFPPPRSQGEVAVVGGGPAGLAAAYYLRREGIVVDLYERRPALGGIPMAGIPAFRLPRQLLGAELAFVEPAGIRVITEEVRDLAALAERYRAVFLGLGLGAPRRAGIPGEELAGVYVADDLLERVNLGGERPAFGEPTVVLGGGNTAFDAAALAVRLGSARVVVAYRRGEAEMPSWLEHRSVALEEGVEQRFLLIPSEILGDGRVTGVRFQKAELGELGPDGRRSPVPVEGAFELVACRQVVLALGNQASGLWQSLELAPGAHGGPRVDAETMETSRPGIFAGGDLVHGGATVVQAVADGRRAARAIASRVTG
jgi:glutamate synthase (NADPH) small chain